MALPPLASYMRPHYILNFMSCFCYMLTRIHSSTCRVLYQVPSSEECVVEFRDLEILCFLAVIIAVKSRKQKGSVHINQTISTIFLFGKLANTMLFFRQDWRWGLLYSSIVLILLFVFPEPTYNGPDAVTYFRGQALDEELHNNPHTTWLVEFYAPWSPPCSRFAEPFAELSLAYGSDALKFGKINASAYEVVAQKYKVDTAVTSKNLPTVILFENGKEKMRRPVLPASAKSKIQPYAWKKENIVQDFNLNELYQKAKSHAKTK